ncbi:hypothetical protein [Streptomyces sp. ME19-01-6]|uniref:hypothetical protein n=1 Tax=Streptomyces sp. ME19-01-6 TaxID=3028686 RepID=UPI0039F4CCCA
METQAKFADTIYTYADRRLLVNLFIPSELRWQEKGITWRQTTGFPDQQTTTLTVASGAASLELRVRIPSWATGARAALNGTTLPRQPKPGSWLVVALLEDRRPRRADPADGAEARPHTRRPGCPGRAVRAGRARRGVRQPPQYDHAAAGEGLGAAAVRRHAEVHRHRERRDRHPAPRRPRPPPELQRLPADR